MQPNERNLTMSVTFDEDKNVVREFSKVSKIEKGGKPPSYRKDADDKKEAVKEDKEQLKG